MSAPCILVHCPPHDVEAATIEVRAVLADAGEPAAIVRIGNVPGTLRVLPEGDIHETLTEVRRLLSSRPQLFAHTTRWRAVDAWVPTNLDAIKRAVAPFARTLGATDSWKVSIGMTRADVSPERLIDAVAAVAPQAPIDLDHPRCRIGIDVCGDETAVGFDAGRESFRVADHKDDARA